MENIIQKKVKKKISEALKNGKSYGFGKFGSLNSNSKPKKHYETKSCFRSEFKKICKNQGWDFDDFEEIFAEWKYTKDKRLRKYYYKFKGSENNMNKVKINIMLENGVGKPFYATCGSVGMDVKANINEPIILKSLERKLIPTGIKMEIPEGYEIQVRPRSGLALKHGISMVNTPGTIDSDYRGDIGIILINLSSEEYIIHPQERIAQLVLNKVEQMELVEVDSLSDTERNASGFGSTGK